MQNLSVVVRAHQHRNGHADDEADAVNKDAEDEAIVEEDEEEQDGMHIDGISSDEEEEEEGIPAWEEYTSEDDYGTGGGESSDDDDCFSDKKNTNSEVEEAEEDDDDVICIKCKRGDDACVLLLCDGLACTTPPVALHTYCCNPPLAELPEDEWFCDTCATVVACPPTAVVTAAASPPPASLPLPLTTIVPIVGDMRGVLPLQPAVVVPPIRHQLRRIIRARDILLPQVEEVCRLPEEEAGGGGGRRPSWRSGGAAGTTTPSVKKLWRDLLRFRPYLAKYRGLIKRGKNNNR